MKIMTRSLVGMLVLFSGDDDDGSVVVAEAAVVVDSAEHSLFLLACRSRRLLVEDIAASKSNVANPEGAVHPRTSPGLNGFT